MNTIPIPDFDSVFDYFVYFAVSCEYFVSGVVVAEEV